MSFVLSEDQQMLRDTAMAFARDEMPVTRLRELRDGGANGVDADTRGKLAELGFFGVLVPEEHDGVGLGMVAMGQIMEAQGRTIAATPLLQSAVLSASTLILGGSEAQKAEWLPKIASGEATMAVAVDEGTHHAPLNIATEAERNGQGYTLNGAKRYVTDGHHADAFIIAARTFGEAGQAHGISLFLVPNDANGLTVQALNTVDSHGAAHLHLEDVAVDEDHVIGGVDAGWEILEPALDRGRIALAAAALGRAQAAKMFTELELTRSCIAAALSGVDENRNDIAELASLAKAKASDLIHLVSNETVQFHGGIGMTDAHDSGLYMKRARVQEALLGGATYHRDRYAKLNGF